MHLLKNRANLTFHSANTLNILVVIVGNLANEEKYYQYNDPTGWFQYNTLRILFKKKILVEYITMWFSAFLYSLSHHFLELPV